jgi:predicted DNA-binding antitoxin AbrB/MazE fold protein
MERSIAVVYEKGMLRPLSPLNLPEHTRLEIQIVEAEDESKRDAEKAYQILVQAGLVQPPILREREPTLISAKERREVADAYGLAGSLSDVIITERDEA